MATPGAAERGKTVIIHPRRSRLLSIGLGCAALVGLVGCGGQSATGTQTASQAAAVTSAVPSAIPIHEAGAVCTLTPAKFDPKAKIDLNGAWAGDDGGIYYVRQRDNVIWWNGMSSRNYPAEVLGRDWNNVGRGEISDDLTIAADWVDVPRGRIAGYGTVDFKIGADGAGNLQITKTSETGTGRGDTTWSRCEPGFPS
jgi:hypothetical protein